MICIKTLLRVAHSGDLMWVLGVQSAPYAGTDDYCRVRIAHHDTCAAQFGYPGSRAASTNDLIQISLRPAGAIVYSGSRLD